MNGIMDEKGRQTKLLAAIAVLAMVICAFAVVMPSDNVEGAITPVDATGVTQYTEPVTSYADGDPLNYYVAASSEATDATLDLDGVQFSAATTINIYMQSGATISITTASSNLTVNLYTVSGTPTSGTATGTVNLKYYDETETAVANATATAVTIDATDFGFSTETATNITNNATMVAFKPSTNDDTQYYNTAVVGNGMNSFELKTGGSLAIPASSTITGNFTVSNDDTSAETTEFTAANTVQFNTGAIQTGQPDAFTVSTEISITNTGDVFTLATGGWTTGSMDVTLGMITVTGSITGDVVNSVGNAAGTQIYSDLAAANGKVTNYVLYSGSHSGNITINGQFQLKQGASYNGTITVGDEGTAWHVQIEAESVTNDTIVVGAGNNIVRGNATIVGTGTDAYPYDSDVTVTNIEKDDGCTDTITLTGVALRTSTLSTAITVGNNTVIPSGQNVTLSGETSATSPMITVSNEATFFVLGNLRGTAGEYISGDGDVKALDVQNTNYYMVDGKTAGELTTGAITLTYTGAASGTGSAQDIIETLTNAAPGTSYIINGNATDLVLPLTGEIDLNDITIYLSDYGNVTVADGSSTYAVTVQIGTAAVAATVTMDNVTIYGADSSIQVMTQSSLRTTGSYLYVAIGSQSGTTVVLDNGTAEYNNAVSNVSVGAGMTLTLNGDVNNVVDVFGNLIINSDATVNTSMTVYPGASVTVTSEGTMTIYGQAHFMAGSEGTIEGTITVGNNQGGALLDVEEDFTVADRATLTVTSVQSSIANKNRLNAPDSGYKVDADSITGYSYEYMFIVEGTANINGMLAGYIHDQGTVTINGFSDPNTSRNTVIVLYEGVTLDSVSYNGTIEITDEGVADSRITASDVMKVSDNNSITLKNASGVTVTTSVVSVPYTVQRVSHVDYYTVMTVYGDVGAVSGSTDAGITISKADGTVGPTSDPVAAYVSIPTDQAMTFGAYVDFVVDGHLIVDGNVEFYDSTVGSNHDDKQITGEGTIDVNGEIAVSVSNGAGNNMYAFGGIMNAVTYRITVQGPEASQTDYFTSFATALAVTGADNENTVTVLNNVEAEGNLTIPVGLKVALDNNAILTVTEGSELILADGSSLTGENTSKIVVEGTFTAQDYANDLGVTDIEAEVVIATEGDPSKTWTTLANAIAIGETEITANSEIDITEDTEIPSGVTVNTEYDVNITEESTLTVNGELNIDGSDLNIEDGSEVVVGGTVSISTTIQGSPSEPSSISNIAGAHYGLTDGAGITYFVSNLADAAERINGAANLYNATLTIVGSVGAQDVEIESYQNITTKIEFRTTGDDNDVPAILGMGTLTLTGNVSVTVSGSNMFTGTIAAICGDGTTNAEIDMVRAGNFVVESGSQPGVTTTYYLDMSSYTNGTVSATTGQVTISAGTVTIATGDELNIASDAEFTVGSGATLNIENNATLDIDSDDAEVSGTINVADDIGIEGNLLVSGTMNATNTTFNPSGVLTVTGALTLGERTVMTVDDALVVGAPAESLGVGGSISGSYTISQTGASSYILVYTGADISGAQLNWNTALDESSAQHTTYYVNDTEYATVYANGAVNINTIFGTADTMVNIEITGLDTEKVDGVQVSGYYTWYDVNGTEATRAIGNPEAVYIEFAPANVSGVVTIGSGINLYIDGVQVLGYTGGSNGEQTIANNLALGVGTHRVSYEISAGWDGSTVVFTFNGETIENDSTITITADMTSFTLSATGATNSTGTSGGSTSGGDDGMGLTDYLLIVLVVLIVIMAIMVALRLMRS